jgi:hypothetical protein
VEGQSFTLQAEPEIGSKTGLWLALRVSMLGSSQWLLDSNHQTSNNY